MDRHPRDGLPYYCERCGAGIAEFGLMAKIARKTEHRVGFGPTVVPTYPYSAFSRIPRGIAWDLWKLCGPTVERNLQQPLWAQFCAVYYEGLNHGAGAARELDSRPPIEPRDSYRELMAVCSGDAK